MKIVLIIFISTIFLSISEAIGSSEKQITEQLVNAEKTEGNTVMFWLTDAEKNIKFTEQINSAVPGKIENAAEILINTDLMMQEMDGFGFTLNGGSALHIHNMSAASRHALLTELFDTQDNNIGVSYLRLSIGASDLDEQVFSYNDLSAGQIDLALQHFTLDEDRKYLIPLLKEILKINPDIKILASPWSPPAWMKSNHNSKGGSLKKAYYTTYAKYLVKYVQEMAEEEITIDAITVQNEPLHPGNNPSLLMLAHEQASFIKNSLGPEFKRAGINTKIIIYDHNADRPNYPISILDDPIANSYIDGSAFHLYAGDISALSKVHNAHPDKNIYFTEQWVSASGDFFEDFKWHIRELVIGAPRNWSKTVFEWNLAADKNQRPYTEGGCSNCLGALTIEGDEIIRNPAYYIIAHISKFVRPGSRRIYSTTTKDLPNIAFKTTNGRITIIVLNNSNSATPFNIMIGNKSIHSALSAGAVGTYVWDVK